MTTGNTEAVVEAAEASQSDDKPEDAKGLRKQLAQAHSDLAVANAKILTPAYEKLGLSPETGLGKAIAKEYDGPADYDALAAFAESEYGHAAPELQPDANPLTTTIHDESKKLEQVGGIAQSVVPKGQTDVLQEAEAAGDYQKTMAIKGQQIADMF